jgi:hypothetical protein
MIVVDFLLIALNLYCMSINIRDNRIKLACLNAFAAGTIVGVMMMMLK